MLAREALMRALLYSWLKVSPQHSTVQAFQRLCHCRVQLLEPSCASSGNRARCANLGKDGLPSLKTPMAEGEKQLPQVVLRPPHVYHSKCGGGNVYNQGTGSLRPSASTEMSELYEAVAGHHSPERLPDAVSFGSASTFCLLTQQSWWVLQAVTLLVPLCWLADWMSARELCSCICSAPWAVNTCASL